MLQAVGHALSVVGVSYSHFRSLRPLDIADFSRRAHDVYERSGIEVSGQVAALRDTAKLLMRHALLAQNPQEARDARNRALANLERSSDLAWQPGESDRREAWLLTQLTLAECLILTDQLDQAERVLLDARQQPLSNLIAGAARTPVEGKLLLTRAYLAARRRRFAEVADELSAFRTNPWNARYADRLQLIADLELRAATGHLDQIDDLILR